MVSAEGTSEQNGRNEPRKETSVCVRDGSRDDVGDVLKRDW